MTTMREHVMARLLAPYGIAVEDVMACERVPRACYVAMGAGGYRIVVDAPVLTPRRASECIPFADEAALTRSARCWLPIISQDLRHRALLSAGLGPRHRPDWSLVVDGTLRAIAVAAGIPAERLCRWETRAGRPTFPYLHGEGREDVADTPWYSHETYHLGDRTEWDYLRGGWMDGDDAHHARHALQLLEDETFPIRSFSAQGGNPVLELRRLLPSSVAAAAVGRRLGEIVEIPGINPSTSTTVRDVVLDEERGTTTLTVDPMRVPGAAPPDGVCMKWAALLRPPAASA